jgi:hypothetical protein
VTVGGIDQIPPLDADEFARDLRMASRFTDDVFVFSLEGCVRQGYLKMLADFDWDAAVKIPAVQARHVRRVRAGVHALLRASAHPFVTAATLCTAARLLWRS